MGTLGIRCFISFLAISLLFSSFLASNQAVADTSDSWEFHIAPYAWLAGLDGSVATLPGLPPADIDIDFYDDILGNINGAFMLVGEARKGRFGITMDLVYTDIETDSAIPGQNFTTLQSKRLTPLIFAGYQVGMVAGGLILITAVPLIGLNNAPLIWAALLVAASFMLMIRHRSRPSPYYFSAAKSSRSRLAVAIGEISEGVDYVRRSSLLRNASFALFFVVITFYMLSFSAHSIYTRVFDDEEKLAAFFGILVVVTNASAMLIQLLLSNRPSLSNLARCHFICGCMMSTMVRQPP